MVQKVPVMQPVTVDSVAVAAMAAVMAPAAAVAAIMAAAAARDGTTSHGAQAAAADRIMMVPAKIISQV